MSLMHHQGHHHGAHDVVCHPHYVTPPHERAAWCFSRTEHRRVPIPHTLHDRAPNHLPCPRAPPGAARSPCPLWRAACRPPGHSPLSPPPGLDMERRVGNMPHCSPFCCAQHRSCCCCKGRSRAVTTWDSPHFTRAPRTAQQLSCFRELLRSIVWEVGCLQPGVMQQQHLRRGAGSGGQRRRPRCPPPPAASPAPAGTKAPQVHTQYFGTSSLCQQVYLPFK